MSKHTEKPDTAAILRGLKDFQRDTVEHVFRRLYLDPNPTRRFLIADEVGLGKTLVARGLIACAIEHLWDRVDRVDIVYICSNVDIARQNIRRLNVTGKADIAFSSRITLLPIRVRSLSENKINFVSFTPGTSFNMGGNLGVIEERVVLYWLLQQAWGFERRATGPRNVLQGNAGTTTFRGRLMQFNKHDLDPGIVAQFTEALRRAEPTKHLRARFEELSERFQRTKDRYPDHDRWLRSQLIGNLRTLLAETCLAALEPDLIILDEFQRFKELLEEREHDDVNQLAHQLFNYADGHNSARVVLLSATPYKMYTVAQDREQGDDHYQDFLRTIRFLQPERADELATLVGGFRKELFRLHQHGGNEMDGVRLIKVELERRLREVMVRTERLGASPNRDGMLTERIGGVRLDSTDVQAYLTFQRVARALGQPDTLEYWKSAPYLLNFMDAYQLKQDFKAAQAQPEQQEALVQALTGAEHALLAWPTIAAYRQLDPRNARLRGLCDHMIEPGAWQLLWVPPALAYYELAGPFADPTRRQFTKRLIFSSWQVVPKVIATAISYEAERRMILLHDHEAENTPEARVRRRGLLAFRSESRIEGRSEGRTEGRLTGMPVLALLYPCLTLAQRYDPLHIAQELKQAGQWPTLNAVAARIQSRIEADLQPIATRYSMQHRPEDQNWYWAALLLLDQEHFPVANQHWFKRPELAQVWSGALDARDDESNAWHEHVQQASKFVAAPRGLGRPPENLARILTLLALGGPGIAMLRSLWRITTVIAPELGIKARVEHQGLRDAAAQTAWAFRSLYNLPEAMGLIRGLQNLPLVDHDAPYWQRVLAYGAAGGLQATLDEYVHVLRESLGLLDTKAQSVEDAAKLITTEIRSALGLRTVALGVDEVQVNHEQGTVQLEGRRLRSHFALRFGDEKTEDGKGESRKEQVRQAFNSPFWPFVLATTSVGQEGLDFHTYCHAIVHWNLPANPVDLEQREGRIHRYKGHAVRKNLVERYGHQDFRSLIGDPWAELFTRAANRRAPGELELIPYWVFPGSAQIERHVPALPLSRDRDRLEVLRRSLTLYRMVFGQNRQEDLLAYLREQLSDEQIALVICELRISLEPPHASAILLADDGAIVAASIAPAETAEGMAIWHNGQHTKIT